MSVGLFIGFSAWRLLIFDLIVYVSHLNCIPFRHVQFVIQSFVACSMAPLLANVNGYSFSDGGVYPLFWNTHLLHTYHHHAMVAFSKNNSNNVSFFYYAQPYVIVYINPMLIKCSHTQNSIELMCHDSISNATIKWFLVKFLLGPRFRNDVFLLFYVLLLAYIWMRVDMDFFIKM